MAFMKSKPFDFTDIPTYLQFVADEDGFVSLIKPSVPKGGKGVTSPYAWLCHRNAIFDVALTGEH
jgi:hypothetical protein